MKVCPFGKTIKIDEKNAIKCDIWKTLDILGKYILVNKKADF